ncbi:neuferricin-like protein [Leptotrombidium deliense]|uniref:Neuferricin-like protein n=1 Tax=Leptotrombidium deliense TaxID=299467 RepID=A0A443SB12_9ACAR|nr:neuferricin-like protein [Leptotrombidium deliense]
MNKFVIFSFLVAVICALVAYLSPDLGKQSIDILLEVQKQLTSTIAFTSSLFGFNENTVAENSRNNDAQVKQKKQTKPLKLKASVKCMPKEELLFTPEELKEYDGGDGSPGLYLAYLGIVYDVSKGKQHYGPGGGYAFFAGKDGSRAFITGEFNEKGLVDDVYDLSVESFGGVREWSDFYEKDYVRVGRVVGTYYNEKGCGKERLQYLEKMYRLYDEQRESEAEETKLFPPCNSEWSGQTNITRVWCSKMSGGIDRGWAGVPRKFFSAPGKGHRCACVRDDGLPNAPSIQYADEENNQISNFATLNDPRLEEYSDCDPKSYECILKE